MNADEVRNALRARPFVPFRIRLADGQVFSVPHSEFASQTPSGRVLYVHDGDDQTSVVDVLLVTALEFGNGNDRKPATGGKPKRKRGKRS